MLLSRFFNSRSFVVAQRFSTLSRNSVNKKNLLSHMKQATGKRSLFSYQITHRPNPDISMIQGIMWIVGVGIPVAAVGLLISQDLRGLIEAEEAGLLMKRTGPEYRLSNDQWLVLKEKARALAEAEEEDDEDEVAELESAVETAVVVEEEFVIIQSPSPTDEPIAEVEKDTIIFIQPPAKE